MRTISDTLVVRWLREVKERPTTVRTNMVHNGEAMMNEWSSGRIWKDDEVMGTTIGVNNRGSRRCDHG